MLFLLIVIVILACLSGGWGYRSGNRYGYGGAGLLGVVLVIFLILLLARVIPWGYPY